MTQKDVITKEWWSWWKNHTRTILEVNSISNKAETQETNKHAKKKKKLEEPPKFL